MEKVKTGPFDPAIWEKAVAVAGKYHYIAGWNAEDGAFEAQCIEYDTAVGSGDSIANAIAECQENAAVVVAYHIENEEAFPPPAAGEFQVIAKAG